MDMDLYIEALKVSFLPYLKSIQGFHFYFDNPLFWVFFMALYLGLTIGWSWSGNKAFFYCAAIALILLDSTWFKNFMANSFVRPGEKIGSLAIFDPSMIKIMTLCAVSAATIYFVLIDNS